MTIDELIAWAKAEHARRTKALADGVQNIDWLDPAYRVTVSEILAKADSEGMTVDPIELRRRLHTQSW
jgi:hypothetical protein